jgi:hypothetical protein
LSIGCLNFILILQIYSFLFGFSRHGLV